MKKLGKIALALLGIILVFIIYFTISNWDYVKAFVVSLRYSNTQIEEQIDKNQQKVDDVLKDYSSVVVREPSEEELEELEKGTITEDELADKIVKEGNTKSEPENTGSEDDYDKQIASKVAKMYVLKSYYLGQLASIEQKIIDDYNALPTDQKNAEGKKNVANKYYNYAINLEAECDAKVEVVISELKEVLTQANKDFSMIDSIRSAYKEEKTLKKAYYMDILSN